MDNLITTEPTPLNHSDLYSLLGVSKNATPEEIRLAYKKAAGEHHPDRDGDPEIFKAVKQAYEVLSDPKKRQSYDATGIFEGEDAQNVETARGIIEGRVEAIINNPDISLGCFDLVSHLKTGIKNNVKQCGKGIKQIEKAIKRLNKYKKRAKVGLIRSVFDKNITDHESALKFTTQDKKVFELAIKILDTCGYEFDEEPKVSITSGGLPMTPFHVNWPEDK